MMCPKGCGRLSVTNSYKAGNSALTQRLTCRKCKLSLTSVTIITTENPDRGQGAICIAKKLVPLVPELAQYINQKVASVPSVALSECQ